LLNWRLVKFAYRSRWSINIRRKLNDRWLFLFWFLKQHTCHTNVSLFSSCVSISSGRLRSILRNVDCCESLLNLRTQRILKPIVWVTSNMLVLSRLVVKLFNFYSPSPWSWRTTDLCWNIWRQIILVIWATIIDSFKLILNLHQTLLQFLLQI